MKQVVKTGLFVGCILWLVCMYGCSHDSERPGAIVTISTNKTSIKADNKDNVYFTVTVGGQDITSSVVITEKNTNIPVEGMTFSTDSAATYTFFAVYDNVKSNEIRIDAIDIEIKLSVNTQAIKADNKDIVTFSVKADDKDVTSSATIMQVESQESLIAGSGFSTKIPGVYTFYATYDGKKSNEIRVDVSAVVVSLSVDQSSIKANNWDKATFTVKAGDADVTASAVIMQITKHSDRMLESQEFLTDEAGKYTFYAKYEDAKSNDETIEATYVNLAFLKGYGIFEVTSTACPVCMVMTKELKTLQQARPNRIHVVALHPSGKYCDSDLSGALGATAVSFVDHISTNYSSPPWALVDIYNVVNIKINIFGEYVTQRYLTAALDNATNERNGASLTGMAVRSTVNGSKIDFEVSLKTIKTDTYRFFAFVVEDGVVNRQALSGQTMDPNHIFNNVATYQLTEGDPFFGVNLGTIMAGSETTRSFSIDTGKFRIGRNVNLSNCRIVCYTLRSNNDRNYFVDNVTSCPVNGSVRYLYER